MNVYAIGSSVGGVKVGNGGRKLPSIIPPKQYGFNILKKI